MTPDTIKAILDTTPSKEARKMADAGPRFWRGPVERDRKISGISLGGKIVFEEEG